MLENPTRINLCKTYSLFSGYAITTNYFYGSITCEINWQIDPLLDIQKDPFMIPWAGTCLVSIIVTPEL